MAISGVHHTGRSGEAPRFATAPSPGDVELVAAMLRGEERAFRLFFNTYFSRIYRFALRPLKGDTQAARDVAQHTLSRAIRNLAAYRGEAMLFTWLCQICRRRIFDLYRSQKRVLIHLVPLEGDARVRAEVDRVKAPVELEPQHTLEAAESASLIKSVLRALPARYADVLEWKYVHGHSVQEISALLGTGLIAAESMLARARNAFRRTFWSLPGGDAMDVLAGSRRA